MSDNNIYHDGERAVQDRINISATAQSMQRLISNSVPIGALPFIESLPMAIIGSRDPHGYLWASIIFGDPGFLHATDGHSLRVNMDRAAITNGDPLLTNIVSDSNVGLLLIEPSTRRRLRINGRLTLTSFNLWTLNIAQAYANCPKYIQRRLITFARASQNTNTDPALHGNLLNARHHELIAHADTFFAASAHPDHGLDMSHRGGPAGFVQRMSDTCLRIPDYPGNNMFNTLGNIYSNPHVGIVFIDFQRNRLLQLTGTANIIWQNEEPPAASGGTQRYWDFECVAWRESAIPLQIDWTFIDASPFNPVSVCSDDTMKY